MRGVVGVLGILAIVSTGCTSHLFVKIVPRDGDIGDTEPTDGGGPNPSDARVFADESDTFIGIGDTGLANDDVVLMGPDGPTPSDGWMAKDESQTSDTPDGPAGDSPLSNDGATPADASVQPRDTSRREASDSGSSDVSTCFYQGVCDGCARYECNACAPLNGTNNTGMALSLGFWPGFPFQVSKAGTIRQVGLFVVQDAGSSGTAFVAIVALTGPSDQPNSIDLSTSDVVGTGLITLPPTGTGAIVTISLPAIQLTPGWYAVVFGLGKFGATATGASIPFENGNNICVNGQYPFSLQQKPPTFISNIATPHMFVDVQ